MLSVTLETLTVLAGPVLAAAVPLAAGLLLAGDPEPPDEHAAPPSSKSPASAPAPRRRPGSLRPHGRGSPVVGSPVPRRRFMATFLIWFLPSRRPARRAGVS